MDIRNLELVELVMDMVLDISGHFGSKLLLPKPFHIIELGNRWLSSCLITLQYRDPND